MKTENITINTKGISGFILTGHDNVGTSCKTVQVKTDEIMNREITFFAILKKWWRR